MAKRKRKEAATGKALVLAGAFLKIIQIIGASLNSEVLSGTMMTLITSCVLVGGLAVYAIERLDLTAAAAALSVVGILGSLLSLEKGMYSIIFLMLTFGAFSVMLIASKRKRRIVAGALIPVFAVLLLLQILGTVSLPGPIVTLLLCLVYGTAALGLYI